MPCFELNNKDFIRRDDLDAEKFKIKYKEATVARSIRPEEYQQIYTKSPVKVRASLTKRSKGNQSQQQASPEQDWEKPRAVSFGHNTITAGLMPAQSPAQSLQ